MSKRNGPRGARITTLFLDIGGVVLTDGWDHQARRRAAKHFQLDWSEMEARHRTTFETYERGKLTLEEYERLVVFHQTRSFTRTQFRRFMFAQSKPHPKMIELVTRVKATHGVKVAVVSNEARELNAYRPSTSTTRRCSSRSRAAWASAASFTRTIARRARNWPRSAS